MSDSRLLPGLLPSLGLHLELGSVHDLGRGLGLDFLRCSGWVLGSKHRPFPGFKKGVVPSWVCPVLTSRPRGLVRDAWEPGTGEKGLSGLVRLIELKGLAGLLVLKEPDGPLVTVDEKHRVD